MSRKTKQAPTYGLITARGSYNEANAMRQTPGASASSTDPGPKARAKRQLLIPTRTFFSFLSFSSFLFFYLCIGEGIRDLGVKEQRRRHGRTLLLILSSHDGVWDLFCFHFQNDCTVVRRQEAWRVWQRETRTIYTFCFLMPGCFFPFSSLGVSWKSMGACFLFLFDRAWSAAPRK